MALSLYLCMLSKLHVYKEDLGATTIMGQACTAAYDKLKGYYTQAKSHEAAHSVIAMMLDPRMNAEVFDINMSNDNQKLTKS